jgi:hypothetical protein
MKLIEKQYTLVILLTLLFYISMNKSLLVYLFESILGRTLLVLFIMIASSFNMLLGVTSLVILVGFYNSKVFEGLENQNKKGNSDEKDKNNKNKKSNDIVSSFPIAMQNQVNKISESDKKIDPVENPIKDKTPKTQPLASSSVIKETKPIKETFESRKQNRLTMLNIEGCIRPKCSNSLPLSSLDFSPASYEPESNFSGIESFQSGYSIY